LYDQAIGTTSIANDPAIAGKMFIGSINALTPGTDPDYFIDSSVSGGHTFVENLSYGSQPYYDTTLTVAAETHQFRILSNALSGSTGPNNPYNFSDILNDRGGISHTLEQRLDLDGVFRQIYSIENADIYGDKNLTINLNASSALTLPSSGDPYVLLHGDMYNRLGVGVVEFDKFKAQLTIKDSIVVGERSFYSGYLNFDNDKGIISQGNLAIGTNDNQYHTGAFYNPMSSGGPGVASIVTDIDSDPGSYRSSTISISSNFYNGAGYNKWNFTQDAQQAFWNNRYRNLSLNASLWGLTATPGRGSANVMEFGLTAGNNFGSDYVLPIIGVGGITDPHATFEVGGAPYGGNNHISLGQMGGGSLAFDASSYIGFNLHRSPVTDSWLKRTDGSNNSGKAIWGGMYDQSLNISFFPSGYSGASSSPLTGITDEEVTQTTRVSIKETGAIHTDNTYRAAYFLNPDLGLYVGFGPTGTTGTNDPGSPGNILSSFRSPVAYFGKWTQEGSPVIYSTNGITQNSSIIQTDNMSVLPQYAFYGNNGGANMGMYLAQGGIGNTATFGQDAYQVGLAAQGISAISAGGNWWSGGIVGINQRNPRERFQISEKLVFHDESFAFGGGINSNGTSYFGYNIYSKWNPGLSTLETFRMSGSSTGIKEGYAKIAFPEYSMSNTSGLGRFNNVGTKIVLEVGNLGATNDFPTTTLPYDNTNAVSTYRGVIISPPLQGPSTHTNYSNYVPQVGIGLKLDNTYTEGGDSNVSARRGTLAIASQMRLKPNPLGPLGQTHEDIYNIGLYNHEGLPVAAIATYGGNSLDTTTKKFEIDFIGSAGDVNFEDITLLYASTDNSLVNKFQRTAQFGDSFRVGINNVPNELLGLANIDNLYLGDGHDVASLTVAAGLTGTFYTAAAQYNPAAIFKGSVIIDQTPFDLNGNGGNNALWFKAGGITGSNMAGPGTKPVTSTNTYAGDWGIQYAKPSGSVGGLSFFRRASNTDTRAGISLFISDATNSAGSSVGIGTQTFTYTSSYPASAGSTTSSTLMDHIRASAPGVISGFSVSGGTLPFKLAVQGNVYSTGLMVASDRRLKNELGRLDKENSLQVINGLSPVLFEWKKDGKITSGFFAQEVGEFMPEAVFSIDTGEFEDGQKSLEMWPFIAHSVNAIKAQSDIIEKQAQTIKNLEDRLSKIEELLSKM
jgi:hypothetical protein